MSDNLYYRVMMSLEADFNKYRHVFYSPKTDEISLVKCLCRVDGKVCVDRTKNGIFGHYDGKDHFLKSFIYLGEL
jgi:hypothetical protein